jgi:hypothetical protein
MMKSTPASRARFALATEPTWSQTLMPACELVRRTVLVSPEEGQHWNPLLNAGLNQRVCWKRQVRPIQEDVDRKWL